MNYSEHCKRQAVEGMEFFLRNFSHVPVERLHWSPTPTSKSPMRIAAHVALYAGRFAQMIEERRLPQPEFLGQWLEDCVAEEMAIVDRLEIDHIYRSGTARFVKALDGLSDADLELTLDSGQGWSVSMRHVMGLAGWRATLHAGQIDFLQTCWDDQEIHLG